MIVVAKFALFDPTFYNGLVGPVLLLAAVWIGARKYTQAKTAEVGIATSGLLRDELEVARERGDRLQVEKDALLAEVVELKRQRSNEPVLAGLAQVMGTLTAATQDMVTEIKKSTEQAAERQEAVMQTVTAHEKRAQDRHASMMGALQKMADAIGKNGS